MAVAYHRAGNNRNLVLEELEPRLPEGALTTASLDEGRLVLVSAGEGGGP